jgi:hypothetical protein
MPNYAEIGETVMCNIGGITSEISNAREPFHVDYGLNLQGHDNQHSQIIITGL